MIYNLESAVFDNDFYVLDIGNGVSVIFNRIDENPKVEDEEVVLNGINVAVVDNEDNYHTGVNVIGLSDEFFSLTTEYKEYLGKPLDKDNIKYCKVEVSDD